MKNWGVVEFCCNVLSVCIIIAVAYGSVTKFYPFVRHSFATRTFFNATAKYLF